eukprot:UN11588
MLTVRVYDDYSLIALQKVRIFKEVLQLILILSNSLIKFRFVKNTYECTCIQVEIMNP